MGGAAADHAHVVLVVDDYEDTRDALQALLHMERFWVETAASGHEALDMLQAGLRPCIVLLDLRMPGMSGWDVFARMQEHAELRHTAVVILSGEPADEVRARRVGICEFLRKPTDKETLIAAIERHCKRRGSR